MTPAAASTSLTSRISEMTTHTHTRARASPSLQTGGGACEHPTAPFARPGVCTSASYGGGNRVRGTGRSERVGGGIGVGGGNGDGNGVGGGDGDVNGHGDGDGAGTG